MADINRLLPGVAEKLGYYVYLYLDPRTGRPFYVGKGKGARVLAHLSDEAESRKTEILRELEKSGLEPHIDILARGLRDEEEAFRVEAAVIDVLGLGELSNAVRGWGTGVSGREPLPELIATLAAEPVEIVHPSILIRINRLYEPRMEAHVLYEATRGVWKIGKRREKARYAMAIYDGVVRAVYEIESWHPAGTTDYATRERGTNWEGRWEFEAHPAPPEIQERYLGKSVVSYLSKGSQNPIRYVGC
ncbi:MAG: hypothetical protein KY432_08890 [Acidobacteria bacterium]|nr:hypothetical protein [Acidobacteriota bacterium]